jgi:hypothetical protein
MLQLILTCIFISAAIGLILKFIFDRKNSDYKITRKEYAIVLALISLVIAPATVGVGWKMAKANQMTFYEFWNGWEMHAGVEETICQKNGSCHWTYECEPHYDDCFCDKDGCQSCIDYEDCPYSKSEIKYIIQTTIGDYVIAEHRLLENPQQFRWNDNVPIPDRVIASAGVGDPPFWTEAKKRIDAGNPGPVTKIKPYDNFILASDRASFKQKSDDVENFFKKGLLPIFQSVVTDYYFAKKIYCVGFRPDGFEDWVQKLDYFNAALGIGLQGDLHLVLVKSDVVKQNADAYANALRAYWQDVKMQGKNALSKNSIVVIIVTDGRSISTARSFTGMPLGNEQMLKAINNRLEGVEFNPSMVIGQISKKNLESHAKGILEDIIFGISDKSTKFGRISMSSKDKRDIGTGFRYLLSEIRPSPTQEKYIWVVAFLFSSIGWIVALIVGPKSRRRYGYGY